MSGIAKYEFNIVRDNQGVLIEPCERDKNHFTGFDAIPRVFSCGSIPPEACLTLVRATMNTWYFLQAGHQPDNILIAVSEYDEQKYPSKMALTVK